MTKKVILMIAHTGYQSVEYGLTEEILTSEGLTVTTVSDEPGVATASDGSTTEVDKTIESINPVDYDGLFLIGGPGALDCLDTMPVYTLLAQMMLLNKPYGAICVAPRILAKAEVLAHKKATGWNGDNKLPALLKEHEAEYIRQPVVTDGLVVTAEGPDAAGDFAQAILKIFGITK